MGSAGGGGGGAVAHYAVCVMPLGEYNVFVRDEENSHARDTDTITKIIITRCT